MLSICKNFTVPHFAPIFNIPMTIIEVKYTLNHIVFWLSGCHIFFKINCDPTIILNTNKYKMKNVTYLTLNYMY